MECFSPQFVRRRVFTQPRPWLLSNSGSRVKLSNAILAGSTVLSAFGRPPFACWRLVTLADQCVKRALPLGHCRARDDLASATSRQGRHFLPIGRFPLCGSGWLHRIAFLGPAKFSPRDPHPMQNNGQLARHRDARLVHASSLRNAHAPGFEC